MRRWAIPVALAMCAALVGATAGALLTVTTAPPAHALTPNTLNVDGAPGVHLQPTRFNKLDRDGALSVPLPFNRSLWIFADTTGDAFSLKGSTAFADNGVDPNRTIETLNGYGGVLTLLPEADVPCPLGQSTSAWPTSAVGVPQSPTTTLIIIYYQANCAVLGTTYALPRTMGVATLWYDANNPGAPMVAKVVNQSVFPLMTRAGAGNVAGYGAAAVFDPDDNNLYVYGCDYDAQGAETCHVGRTWVGNFANPAAFTFWNGSTFVADRTAAAPVGIGGIISVGPNVQWYPQLHRYVSSNMPFSFSNVEIRTSSTPWGPWTTAATAEVSDCRNVICRTVSLHPELTDSRAIAVSYVPANVESPMVARLPIAVDPIGSLDRASAGVGSIRSVGWALDPDVTLPLVVALYVDGGLAGNFTANAYRPDVGTAFPAYGSLHGFDVTLPAAPGPHVVCAYAINQAIGTTNVMVGCSSATVYVAPGAPQGAQATAGDGQALVAWAPPADTGGAPAGALTYEVAVTPLVAGSPFAVPAGALSTVVNGLANGTPYSFAVRAATSGGTGQWSPATAPATPAAHAGGGFHPVTPTRVIDTRTGPAGKVVAGAPRDLQVAGVGGVSATATAVVLNVTVTGSDANSFVTASPSGQPVPMASTLNFATGQTVANLATVRLGGGRVSFATAVGSTHIVADLVGWYDDGTGGGDLFNPISPQRVLDSRTGAGWSGVLAAGAPRELALAGTGSVPSSATAVVLNLTSTNATANTFLTAWPAGQPAPPTSNLNVGAGQTLANLTTVKVGAGGKVAFATAAGTTHVVADLVGWYEPGTGSSFHPVLAPTRILDDRTGIGGYSTPVTAPVDRAITVAGANGIPAGATAVVVNTTAVQPSSNSFVTVYPTGAPEPTASAINVGAGQIVPNLVLAKVGAGGQVTASVSAGTVTILMDVSGYFAAS